MPNQRRQDKKYIGVWFSGDEEKMLQRLADKLTDGNRAELIRQWVEKEVQRIPVKKNSAK